MKKLLRFMDMFVWAGLLALALRFGAHTTVWYAGLLLAWACFPFWLVARRQLGDAFTLKPEARQLVTRGLYARLRHPIYLFGSGAYFGALLALQVWPIVAGWLALLPLEVLRARRESRLLAATFGDAYAEYRRKTWF
jgi:protein-S-isoprenylcysteine O-methyltransferase Ste14